jgi:SOS-response transcriptional repressor LexA
VSQADSATVRTTQATLPTAEWLVPLYRPLADEELKDLMKRAVSLQNLRETFVDVDSAINAGNFPEAIQKIQRTLDDDSDELLRDPETRSTARLFLHLRLTTSYL